MQPHEHAQLALDCALHGLPEPDVPWRACLPSNPFTLGADGRGYLGTGRSPNIETMALAAWLLFIAAGTAPKKEKEPALRSASDLLIANRRCFKLNEFGSVIYSAWTLVAWGGIIRACAQMGENALAVGFRELLTEWFALARASLAECPKNGLHVNVEYQIRDGKTAVMDESKSAGKQVVTICGERSWGHGHGLPHAHHGLARVAFRIEEPPYKQAKANPPGQIDGWIERAFVLLTDLFRECAAPAVAAYNAGDWRGLAALLKYPTSQPCELRCYEDGSRVFIEGGDEPEVVDEDDNSNTPRLALLAVYRTPPLIRSLPDWPAPNGGDTRIRQKNIVSDIDRLVDGGGWLLLHSDVGTERAGDRWASRAPDPVSPLVARFTCFGAGDGWVLTRPRPVPETPVEPAPVEPAPATPPRPPRRRPWWRRILGLD